MNAISQMSFTEGLYVYAVLPGTGPAVPEAAAILAGSQIGSLAEAGLAALVSSVPRYLFEADHPLGRLADADWMADCAEAHHRIVALAAQTGPCLPLGFATVFASEASLRGWLAFEAGALRKTLDAVADRQEWGLTLIEDPAAQDAWLEANDTHLSGLAAAAHAAHPGTGALLQRRLARAKEDAGLQHRQSAALQFSNQLRRAGLEARRDMTETGFSWTVLAERDAGMSARLQALATASFAGSGLAVRVTGPWPPYAFARAAWQGSI